MQQPGHLSSVMGGIYKAGFVAALLFLCFSAGVLAGFTFWPPEGLRPPDAVQDTP